MKKIVKSVKSLVIGLTFIVLFSTGVKAQSGDDWVRVRDGKIPKYAVVGGYEKEKTTYICRTLFRGNYVGGKVIDNQCYFIAGNRESTVSRFEVLVGEDYIWRRTSQYTSAVVVGGTDDENFYVCRVTVDDEQFPGTLKDGICYYTRNNRDYSDRRFEVLTSETNTNNLLVAASRGDYQAVRDALRSGQAINQKDSNGYTALMTASEKGYERVVQELLYERATIDIADKYGNTALMLAASKGNSDIVRILLRDGANLNRRNDNGDTAFTLAASGGHSRVVRDFLNDKDNGEIDRGDIERGFRNAAYYGHTDVLQTLINYGVSVESRDYLDGKTALMQAALGGRVDAVRFLLRNDASINSQDNSGLTPFLHGVNSNSDDILKVFMEEKRYIRFDDPEAERGLHNAAQYDKRNSLKYLLEKGVNVNSKSLAGEYTALMLASNEGHDDATEILLKANADLNLQNRNGETALMLAAANSKNNTTKILIKAGANLNIRDNNGMTALGWAIQNKHNDTRKTLQKAKAKQ